MIFFLKFILSDHNSQLQLYILYNSGFGLPDVKGKRFYLSLKSFVIYQMKK